MPTFEISAPNGKTYHVDGENADGALSALQQMHAEEGGAPSTVVDAAKSFGVGLGKGAIGLAGMAGDLTDIGAKGLEKASNYVSDKLGVERYQRPTEPSALNNIPGSTAIQKAVEDNVTGKFYEPKTTAGKYAQSVGEMVPSVLGGPGRVLVKAASAVGAGIGSEAAGQYTAGGEVEPYARVAGAILGGLSPSAISRAITPLPATAARGALVNTLRGEGVDLTAGQATGNKPLQWMESVLGDTPGAGGRPHAMQEAQGEQFTAAALRRIGENEHRASPEVINNAFDRIGGQFDALGARNTLNMDRRFATDLTDTVREYNGLVGQTQRAPIIENTVNDIANLATQHQGQLPGDVYQAMASRLRRQARGAASDTQTADALRGLHTAMDDAMERSIAVNNPADAGAWRDTRNQYRNLMVIEKAATGAGENAAQGLISPSALRNATVVAHGRRNYARGEGDFADLARAGEGVMKPLPNSGTAPRMYAQHLLSGLGGILGTSFGGVHGGIAGLAAPAVIGRAMMSRPVQSYLSNQVLPNVGGSRGTDAVVNAILALQQNREPTRITIHPDSARLSQDH